MFFPRTLDEAVDYLLPKFDGMEKYFGMNEEEFTSFCHSQRSGGIGMSIRNEMGFWTKNTLIYKHMIEVQKLDHPDAMSKLILTMIYRKKVSQINQLKK